MKDKDLKLVADWIANDCDYIVREIEWLLGEVFNNRTLKKLDIQEDIRDVYDGVFEYKESGVAQC